MSYNDNKGDNIRNCNHVGMFIQEDTRGGVVSVVCLANNEWRSSWTKPKIGNCIHI